ncbi:MAG: ABC transporter permease [Muribaculaceae bacterium]|nr:ABC transporter permease [Muribaculaceae bacterium]
MNPFKSIANGFGDFCRAFRNEMGVITHDVGVMLFFVVLPLFYPIVYTLIYNTEVVDSLPFAVVDHSRTPESRSLVRMADATPELELYDYAADMQEARRMWAASKVVGVMEIPADYARKTAQGEQAHVTFFCDMSLLLRYRAALSALTSVQLETINNLTEERINTLGLPASTISASPVEVDTNFLGDTQQGFASFIIPGIVILILQQSMVLGICLIAGTEAEKRSRGILSGARGGVVPTVLGKALAYTFFYIPATIYMLHYVPEWFDLPHQGAPLQWLLFCLPLLMASAMFGMALSHLMRQREDAFIYIVFTSVIFLFLSGLTWPRFAMPSLLYCLADCVPATWGVEGFVRINSNGATLAEQSEPYMWLWGLTLAYFAAAVAIESISRRRDRRLSAARA